MKQVPIWEKYTLSKEEAAVYFRIGIIKLSEWIEKNPDSDCVLWNGNRAQIKRKKFEKYIDTINVI